jgi:ABC-type glycerol-3-phosphate transport system substrate-binding protein
VAGVPTIAQVYNVFANTAALEKAGITAPTTEDPWTWDELAANAKKLSTGGNFGFAWGLKSPTAGLMSSGLAFDGTYFSGDEANPSITVGENEMQVPQRVRAMIDDGSMAPTSTSQAGSEVLPGFFAGKYAMIMAGNYVEAQVEEKAPKGFDWTMLPVLEGTSQAQASNPQTLSIARQSQHPKEAMQFIAWYAQADNLASVAKGDALIPMTTSAAKIAGTELTEHGWPNVLAAGPALVDAPWQKADKFPQWKTETATPAFQEYLAGRIDDATLAKRLTDGWTKAQG